MRAGAPQPQSPRLMNKLSCAHTLITCACVYTVYIYIYTHAYTHTSISFIPEVLCVDVVIKRSFSEDGDLQCRRGERRCHYHLLLSSVAHYSIPHALKGTLECCSHRWPCSHVMLLGIPVKTALTACMHGIHNSTVWKSLWIKVSVSSCELRSAVDHGVEAHRQAQPLGAFLNLRTEISVEPEQTPGPPGLGSG